MATGGEPDVQPVSDPAEVSDIEAGTDSLSFRVDRPGTPVLVKTSYFPNWKASGAEGPWRVAPNLMVVVPTASEVELRYATTPVDVLGWSLTLLGLAGLAALVLKGPLALPGPRRRAPADTTAAFDVGQAGEADGAQAPHRQAEPAEPVGAGASRGEQPVSPKHRS